jgi:1,4-alpha-glucan branching enzyme
VSRIKDLIGWWAGSRSAWNQVRYFLGSHDEIKDETYNSSPDGGRYFVERFGGRDNGWARAKARLGWSLNVVLPGTPMMFMGSEGHMWGYWSLKLDDNGEHRFNWGIVGDSVGAPMQQMVRDINNIRWANPALRSEYLAPVHDDDPGQVVAFKRWNLNGNVILAVINLGDQQWSNTDYGVNMGGDSGTWREIFNSQAPGYGGINTTGNYQADRNVAPDGKLYINLPAWSLLLFARS